MDLLATLLHESQFYNHMEKIDGLVQDGAELNNIPLQPLYLSLKNCTHQQVAKYLPRMDLPMREAMLDLDLWKRDEIDPLSFTFWVEAYSKLKDDKVLGEFVSSNQFALFLKSVANIYTFDADDPQYPQGNTYFLTEDNLLLVEFHSQFKYREDLQMLVKALYSYLGPHQAYTHLFKVISQSYMLEQEGEYQRKKERLQNYGFCDYFDSLALLATFPNKNELDAFIQATLERKNFVAMVDSIGKLQGLHEKCLRPFEKIHNSFRETLKKVEDRDRQDFLRFNLIKLINACGSLSDSLQQGPIALYQSAEETRWFLGLGLDYLLRLTNTNILASFSFSELYKIGRSLIEMKRRQLKGKLAQFHFDDNASFLGDTIENWIQGFFENPTRNMAWKKLPDHLVEDMDQYKIFEIRVNFIVEILPFANNLHIKLQSLKQMPKNKFLNYSFDEIELEVILMSSFFQFILSPNCAESSSFGVSVTDFKKAIAQLVPLFKENFNCKLSQTLIEKFQKRYGLDSMALFYDYFSHLLAKHLTGYDFDKMSDSDFKHVGGPLIFLH